eukprot:4310184-Prymnesium_polylepis.1
MVVFGQKNDDESEDEDSKRKVKILLELPEELSHLLEIIQNSGRDDHVNWDDCIEPLEELLEVLTKPELQPPRREKLRIDAAVVDVWERMQDDRAMHD